MDIDSNFDNDYNAINASKSKKKKNAPEIKSKKEVTFERMNKNSSIKKTSDYEDEDLTDEYCEEENLSNEENCINDHEEEFDYSHEEEFDYSDDCNSINASKIKKKKIEPEVKSKKKVTFECTNKNSFTEETFDFDYEDEDLTDEDCEEENLSTEENCINDHEEEFYYSDDDEQKLSNKDYSDGESGEDLLDENNVNKKTISMKEDIYGRIRKPDGTIVVSIILFLKNEIVFLYHILITGAIIRLHTSTFKEKTK